MRSEVRLVVDGEVVKLWLPSGWDAVRYKGETYRLLRRLGDTGLRGRVGVRVRR